MAALSGLSSHPADDGPVRREIHDLALVHAKDAVDAAVDQ